MRILIATESYYPNIDGGAYAQHQHALRLAKRGHDVAILAPAKDFSNYKESDSSTTIYRHRAITFPLYKDYKISIFPLNNARKAIGEFKPDVIHIHNPYMIGVSTMLWAKKCGIPIIGTNHVLPENLFMAVASTRFAYNFLKNVGWTFIVNFYNHCDLVTSPTKTAVDLLVKHGLTRPVRALSNGIDLAEFEPRKPDDALRKRYGLPEKPLVLYAGRISGEKRLDVLIKAIPLVAERIDAHFLVVGSGRELATIKELARAEGVVDRVTFTGFINDATFPHMFNLADVFVMPSEAELQSIVTMEALASGLPVVAADKHALPELVHDQENGLLFPPGNHKELAKDLIVLLADRKLRLQMGQKSIEIIRPHAIDNVITGLEALYKDALELASAKNAKVKSSVQTAL